MTTREGAAAWLDALVSGDVSTWRSHRRAHPGAVGDAAGAAGASQLELVRRLVMTHPDLPDLPRLADLVVGTAPAGRGPVDLRLPSSAAPEPAWGSPPVEPEELPAAELLRVAVPVLFRLLPPAPGPPDPARTPLRARRFVVHGAPAAAAAVAAALGAAGWAHGPFRAVHVVLACPPDVGVEQVWSRRVAAGSVRSWRRTWRTLHARNTLPARLDPTALTEQLRSAIPSRHRSRRLLVAAGPDASAAAATALAALGITAPAPMSPSDGATVDLHRRLNVLAAADVPRDTGPVDGLAPQHGVLLGVPEPHRAWASAQGERLAAALEECRRRADYPVLGDPGVLATLRGREVATRVDPADTLDRALAAICAAWRSATRTEG